VLIYGDVLFDAGDGNWTDETTVAGRATIGDDYYLRQGGYVFIGISLFVCLLAGLCKKNHSTDFHKIRRKGSHERNH